MERGKNAAGAPPLRGGGGGEDSFLMKISGIFRPLRDVKPVADLIRTLDTISAYYQETKSTNQPASNEEVSNNPHEEIIADLRLSNKLLLYQVSKFETVLDNLNDGIMLLDSSNRVYAINHIMEQLVNLKRGDIKGKHIRDCRNSNEIMSFLLGNAESADKLVEKSMELSAGSSSLRVSFKRLIRDDGNTGGSLLVVKDTTTSKLADNARLEVLSYLSGELNAPLNLIKSYSEKFLKSGSNGREATGQFLVDIEAESARLIALVNNLLRMSKIEMGELAVLRTMTRTGEFIENVYNRVVGGNKKDIKTSIQISEDIAPLSIDRELISLAISNVLSNAINYTPESGTVKLCAEEESENVLIHIIDTGIGISEDDLPQIFDKFYRSSDEMVKKCRGDGMGLSIAREIVRLHEGEIRVNSRKGEGSRFTIVLPAGQGYLLG